MCVTVGKLRVCCFQIVRNLAVCYFAFVSAQNLIVSNLCYYFLQVIYASCLII